VTAQRILFRIALLIVAAILQVVVVNRIPLPGGQPDLLLLVVVGIAFASGAERGALFGFCAGLLADFLPPAGHIAGREAFVYTVIGFGAGLFEDPEETSVLTTILVVAVGSAALVALYDGLGGLLGDARVTREDFLHSLLGTVVYDVVLAPFIVRPVSAFARRLEPVGPR